MERDISDGMADHKVNVLGCSTEKIPAVAVVIIGAKVRWSLMD